jgi:hypothetical protein
MTAPAPASPPSDKSPQGGGGVDTKRRSKRMYVYWSGALTLLITVVLLCWLVVVPTWQVHRAVRECNSPPYAKQPAIKKLGGQEEAIRRLVSYSRLPNWIAPRRTQAVDLLNDCGPAGLRQLLLLASSEDQDLSCAARIRITNRETAFTVASLLSDPDPTVRKNALSVVWEHVPIREAQGAPGDTEVKAFFRERAAKGLAELFLASNDAQVRKLVLEALERLQKDDTKAPVRKAAAEALKRIRAVSSDLGEAARLLAKTVGGKWKQQATNPDIGPMLVSEVPPKGLTAGFYGVVPFPFDDKGQPKLSRYVSTCSASLYVLGTNEWCTVITWVPKTSHASKRIVEVLKLSPPQTTIGQLREAQEQEPKP